LSKYLLLLFFLIISFAQIPIYSQDEEPVIYFQMEPLDDSLFIKIQQELFIDPPDPKAEIVVDVRNQNEQTISIKGALYPFLALTPEIRARVLNYPFKINLEETIHYASVFTNVITKLRFDRILNTPSVFQISPTLGYINPFIQFMGGERFGFSLKKDIGFSFGISTPYSGVLETNYYEINFHILGLKAGLISNDDTFIEHKSGNNHNNIYFVNSYQISYVVPFGNFFEFGYLKTVDEFNETKIQKYLTANTIYNPDGTIKFQPYLVQGDFFNWEFRYPVKILESTRGKFYVGKFVNEIHIGYTGRELSVAGSVFDFRFDAMVSSQDREPQYVLDLMVQKVFDFWAFSVIAAGPSITLGTTSEDKFGFTAGFVNVRIKVGSSL
jgi:hypothetical protein